MKRLLLAAAASSLPLFSAASAASPASFDLRLDQKEGARTIAISNSRTGAFAVAAGGKDLDILEGDDAKAAFERLSKQPDIDIQGAGAEHGQDDHGKRKIIVHKMDYDEDQSGEEESREVRIIKRHQHEADEADEVEIETEIEIEDELDAALAVEVSEKSERRIILINAADARAAAKFIDGIKGLDNAEKADMKAAVGL